LDSVFGDSPAALAELSKDIATLAGGDEPDPLMESWAAQAAEVGKDIGSLESEIDPYASVASACEAAKATDSLAQDASFAAPFYAPPRTVIGYTKGANSQTAIRQFLPDGTEPSAAVGQRSITIDGYNNTATGQLSTVIGVQARATASTATASRTGTKAATSAATHTSHAWHARHARQQWLATSWIGETTRL
jgi:hypothetical protein